MESVVYLKYTDHFTGAIEGWSDAEIITADQRISLASANQIVESATNILRNALITSANTERDVTKLRARYGIAISSSTNVSWPRATGS